MNDDKPVEITPYQRELLVRLARGERVKNVNPVVRRLLRNRGLIKVARMKNHFHIEITDLGREIAAKAKVDPHAASRGKPLIEMSRNDSRRIR